MSQTGRHSRTPEAWQKLTDDLQGAADTNAELDRQLAQLRAELQHEREVLAFERWIRAWQDDLIGRLVQRRELAESRVESLCGQLRVADESNRRCVEIITGLRHQAAGVQPEGAAVQEPNVLQPQGS